jgi:glutamyl-tRNA synthetase
MSEVRVRFAPSPTGDLHVGNIRTALFDWAYARHTGGKLIFRIEDTDRERVTDEYIQAAIDTMKWLGLDWDEGPEVGGPNGPYLQSQRLDIYAKWAQTFLDQKDAYYCYCTPEELEALREEQRKANQAPGYNGRCRNLSAEEIAAFKAAGRTAVIRMRMPEGSTTFTDAIRGEVTFDHNFVPDFVLVRADGSPLYTLAVAVDDVLMKVTHVLRGEDLLSSTPRQIRVYQAMGVAESDFPTFAHLPFVMGKDNAKLSKRNGEVSVSWYRKNGFLPEAICNYLALLGWSPGDDRENITMEELVKLFTVERVHSSPARFDMKKLEALNGDKIRALSADELLDRAWKYLTEEKVFADTAENKAIIASVLPIIQERMVTFAEIGPQVNFLFVDQVEIEAESKELMASEATKATLQSALNILTPLENWNHQEIHDLLYHELIEVQGLKPRHAFAPIRIAVTGSHISPPLFESLALLGKERALKRIKAAL